MKVEKQQTAIAKVCNDLFFRNEKNVWCFIRIVKKSITMEI